MLGLMRRSILGIVRAVNPQPLHDLVEVFAVSTDQSHCRHDMVSLVSTGLAIARPHRKGNSPVDEFIPS